MGARACVCMCTMNAMKNINGRRLILLLSSSHNYVNFYSIEEGKKTRARIIQLNGQYESPFGIQHTFRMRMKKPFSVCTSSQHALFISFYFLVLTRKIAHDNIKNGKYKKIA